jgi:hypothetical protein
MAAYPTNFQDWNAVSSYYGNDVAQALQKQNVPLNQVGSYINNVAPTFFQGGSNTAAGFQSGGSDPGQFGGVAPGISGGFNLAALINAQGQGGGGPAVPPNPYNAGLVGNPMYSLSQLGAAALQQPMIVNPNPSQNQINPQSGVFSGPQNPQISGTRPVKAPAGPWMNTPGIFGGPAQQPPPSGQTVFGGGFPWTGTQGGINPSLPGQPAGGRMGFRNQSGMPLATPPAAPNMQLPTSGITQGVQGAAQAPPSAPGAPPAGTRAGLVAPEHYVTNPTTPGTSAGSIALGNAGIPGGIKVNSGGSIPGQGNTDTVPAMLTPGEFVVNKDAVKTIGKEKLESLNKKGKAPAKKLGEGLYEPVPHMQGGGSVPQQAAIQEAIAQLPAQEQAALNMANSLGAAGSGTATMSPLMMKAQQDLQRILQQQSAKSSVTKPANQGVPQPQAEQQSQVGPANLSQSGPGGVYYGNPNRMQVGPPAPAAPTGPYTAAQTGGGPGSGGYWPAGSTVYPGQYVMGPNQPGSAPGTSTGEILATGDQATAFPTAQGGAGGAGAAAGIAGGIGSALGNLAQGFQNAAKASWHWINPGNWTNAGQYAAKENYDYAQYDQPLQQEIV